MRQITNIRRAVCTMANQLKRSGYTLFRSLPKGMEEGKTDHEGQDSRCYSREQAGAVEFLETGSSTLF